MKRFGLENGSFGCALKGDLWIRLYDPYVCIVPRLTDGTTALAHHIPRKASVDF